MKIAVVGFILFCFSFSAQLIGQTKERYMTTENADMLRMMVEIALPHETFDKAIIVSFFKEDELQIRVVPIKKISKAVSSSCRLKGAKKYKRLATQSYARSKKEAMVKVLLSSGKLETIYCLQMNDNEFVLTNFELEME